MSILTAAAFARKYNVSRQIVSEHCKSGTIVCEKIVNGGKDRVEIDTDNPINVKYIGSIDRGKQIINIAMSKKNSNKPPFASVDSGADPGNGDLIPDVGLDAITTRFLKAKTEKEEEAAIEKKLKNAVRRGELLERKEVDVLFLYLDKVHSNLERLGDSTLADVASQIVDAGKLTSEIRAVWKDSVLEQIDGAKKYMIKKLEEIEDGQK